MPRTSKTSWARIMAPLSGGKGDTEVLAAAAELARPFDVDELTAGISNETFLAAHP